ncbi:MAG: class I SAM-dependent methyltransferase [Dolichospermum sp. LBC05a]|nr:class I SAM-dependent methyltransferase [Dolichospermum sp. OL01]MCO5796836.1 class I SAM-dependent methyltransferase [Dolichospermum sp. OL03]MCS6281295.1 class I SAM-dependent methyltransferase [Dolichospermum sp.]QSV58414.1 MAG: class I SAM-dependent methyltransferase [Dolichospermum sp. LBC05a]
MNKSEISNAYNELYSNEEIIFSDIPRRFPRNRNEALVNYSGSGKRVLEIGCGGGNVLYNIRNQFDEIYGVELSSVRANKLQTKFKRLDIKGTIVVENVENGLQFPDNFFDTIIWADVIEHVVDLWVVMTEIQRILAPKGKLVTCTPNVAELRHRLTLLFGRFPSTGGSNEGLNVRSNALFDEGHLHYFTFSCLENLYRKYDITPIKSVGYGNLGFFHNLYPPLLSGGVCIVGEKQK